MSNLANFKERFADGFGNFFELLKSLVGAVALLHA
jgi:hypothetical protein